MFGVVQKKPARRFRCGDLRRPGLRIGEIVRSMCKRANVSQGTHVRNNDLGTVGGMRCLELDIQWKRAMFATSWIASLSCACGESPLEMRRQTVRSQVRTSRRELCMQSALSENISPAAWKVLSPFTTDSVGRFLYIPTRKPEEPDEPRERLLRFFPFAS